MATITCKLPFCERCRRLESSCTDWISGPRDHYCALVGFSGPRDHYSGNQHAR